MKHHYLEIALGLYFLIGLLGYGTISGVGAQLEVSQKPSVLRRAIVILLWPLAMIGAIES